MTDKNDNKYKLPTSTDRTAIMNINLLFLHITNMLRSTAHYKYLITISAEGTLNIP